MCDYRQVLSDYCEAPKDVNFWTYLVAAQIMKLFLHRNKHFLAQDRAFRGDAYKLDRDISVGIVSRLNYSLE
jgi:hypothetical protein